MAKRPHIFLGDKLAEKIEFSLKSFSRNKPQRDCDVSKHAAALRAAYTSALTAVKAKIECREASNLPIPNGFYLDIALDKDSSIPSQQLDSVRKGPKLMQIKQELNTENQITSQSAVVYVPSSNDEWFEGKLAQYETKKTSNGKPKNKPLLDSIDDVNVADIRSLFPSVSEYDELQPNTDYEFELWLDETDDERLLSTFDDIDRMGFSFIRDNILKFEQVTILLVRGTKETIDDIPFALDRVEAVKRYYNPGEMLSTKEVNREWSKLIAESMEYKMDANSPRISIFDRGVNNAHPLLNPFLPDDRCRSVVDDRPLYFEGEHATGMAGLALFGDLTDQMGNTTTLIVNHDLSSVKLQTLSHDNPPRLYGKLTIDAITESESMNANIICMAMTENKEHNDGTPTSWSAAIDRALYDGGKCDKLMVISTGNTDPSNIHHNKYLTDISGSSIQTPCESLNAIVVGAFTNKVQCQRDKFVPVAPVGGVSPMTRTSMLWRGNNIKPDIVMEGGNIGYNSVFGDNTMPELSLITTSEDISHEPLQPFWATSASTALAARLAAKIKYANPNLSMLSVRALMIHSAEWTDAMKAIDTKKNVIMAYCGYGVPKEQIAEMSEDKVATFIFENTITPYKEGKNDNVYKEMHFYDLPWPKDVLMAMASENVKLRITLSYYIEPSPTQKGVYNKYRYQSAGLEFDVKNIHETREQFIARHNSKQKVENKSTNDSARWYIGKKLRSRGTVQSDWFECSAADLATCNEIAVFPTNGWWRYRKLANVGNSIKYSLVVSITTSETPIYDTIASELKQEVATAVES